MRAESRLLQRARDGDRMALAELYTSHRTVAERVARRTCRPCDVDDVVAETFVKTFDLLARGGGPRESFRAYLITAVRTTSADHARRYTRESCSDGADLSDLYAPSPDLAPGGQPDHHLRLESDLLTRALASLPGRWQLALWWATIENLPLSEVGSRLGINANAAAAVLHRARRGLRNAYLDLHVPLAHSPACQKWRRHVASFVDSPQTARHAEARAHLSRCRECRQVADDLREFAGGASI